MGKPLLPLIRHILNQIRRRTLQKPTERIQRLAADLRQCVLELGRRFATYLGIQAGSRGRDEGVDGWAAQGNDRIYFQCKLEQRALDASRAADFYGNLCLHQATIGVMLSGTGYTSGFLERLQKDPDLHTTFKIHLLNLADVFGETPAFQRAITDLPPLQNLSSGHWRTLLS